MTMDINSMTGDWYSTIVKQTATVMRVKHNGHECGNWAINDLLKAAQLKL